MNTRWVLIEFESLQMIITVLESFKLVSNELNSCISFHSYNNCVCVWKFRKIPRYQAMITENRVTKRYRKGLLTSIMETEKQKFLISSLLWWKICWPKSCGMIFFETSWESQPGTVTVLIICIKAADFMFGRTNRKMALEFHFMNQDSTPKLVWKWITFDASYFLLIFFRKLKCIKKTYNWKSSTIYVGTIDILKISHSDEINNKTMFSLRFCKKNVNQMRSC